MEPNSFEQILNNKGSFIYKSVGVSMCPLIHAGRDCIYICKRPKERLKKYDVVLFRRPDSTSRGKYVLHRILRVNSDGTYWIAGDNCICGETVNEENVLGVLTVVKRKDKMINVSDFGYKLYIYLWCAPWPIRFFILRCRELARCVIRKTLRILRLKK